MVHVEEKLDVKSFGFITFKYIITQFIGCFLITSQFGSAFASLLLFVMLNVVNFDHKLFSMEKILFEKKLYRHKG